MSSWTTFRWHPVELFLVLVTGAGYVHVVRDGRLRRRALSGVAALLMVTAWPIGNLAASVSLSVATLQRLVVMLLVAPLLLTATPVSVLNRVTRPTAIDALARRLAHQCVAMLTVTIMGTATLTPSLVDWGPPSAWVRLLRELATLGAGLVLWLLALGVLPGTRLLSPTARAGYLFASSIVVTSLSFVWIFALHSLYPDLHHQRGLLHLSPLLDQ